MPNVRKVLGSITCRYWGRYHTTCGGWFGEGHKPGLIYAGNSGKVLGMNEAATISGSMPGVGGSDTGVGVHVATGNGSMQPSPVSERARKRIELGRARQSQLARELELTPSHVCLIFAGKRMPSIGVAAALACKLKVTLDELYAYLIEPVALDVN